ncbi:MAG: hypothetical protein ACI8RZ_001732 [Myxococcota bacterium]|jgi:hypothetical protein
MSATDIAATASKPAIKKIIAAKGDLQGNFYAIIGKDGEGIAITLTARDPKGAKALSMGKAMKKEIKAPRYVRGIVKFTAKKLSFELHTGNLGAAQLKQKMKTGFGDDELKKFLKLARIATAGEEVVEKAGTNIEDEAMEGLGVDTADPELAALIAAQNDLNDLNGSLASFLTQKNDDVAIDAIIKSTVAEAEELKKQSLKKSKPLKERNKLRQQVYDKLAELVDFVQVGEDPFAGDEVPPEVSMLIAQAGDLISERAEAALEAHRIKLTPIFTESLAALELTGKHLILGKIRDHNIKVPKTAERPESDADPVDRIYKKIHGKLFRTFLPPSNASLADGSWQKGWLAFLGSDTAEDAIKAEFSEYIAGLNVSADTIRGLDNDTYGTDDPKTYHRIECDSDWETVKGNLSRDPVALWQMVLYRKQTVDGLLAVLNGTHGGNLLAKSVGSVNLTSDYDLTLSSKDGSGREIDAIKAFNDRIKALYTKQPGTVFDTNLYAKDFLKVKSTVIGVNQGDSDGSGIAEVLEMLELDRSDQDVAALTKMRQYMEQDEWEDYIEGFTNGMEKEQAEQLRLQFDEADSLFAMKNETIFEAFIAKYGDMDKRLLPESVVETLDELIQTRSERMETADLQTLIAEQEKIEQLVREAGHLAGDLMLEVRNDIYLDKMKGVRVLQGRHGKLEEALTDDIDYDTAVGGIGDLDSDDPKYDEKVRALLRTLLGGELIVEPSEAVDNPTALDDKTIQTIINELKAESITDGDALQAWLVKKVDALKEEARRELGAANFYAAEAYLSEGPLQHVVNGNQSGNPAVFDKLKPEHFLESINEQTGDFFKDVKHFGDAREGEALYKTCKYLHRMLEGIAKLAQKDLFIEIEDDLPTLAIWGGAGKAMTGIEEKLLPIRGAKGEWASATARARRLAAIEASKKIYKVSTIAALKAQVLTLSGELNKAVRTALAMRPSKEVISDGLGMQG